jgi:hypothetical protein
MKTDISSSGNAAARPGSKSTSSRIPSVVLAPAVSACAIYAAAPRPGVMEYGTAPQGRTNSAYDYRGDKPVPTR